MNTSLATFMTHKIRNGLVSMGVDNPAPVYDNGGTAGYGRSAKPETRLDNDFGRYLLDKKGNPLGCRTHTKCRKRSPEIRSAA
ncbi:hypothetical protein [Leptospira interrogans]|nr:hypothetical protein [Leptospira interrogans]EMN66273.1 hypothetical protein LEP1GSC098_3307 [Leptospira interrogans serovar Grippotyphosa str. UI 08434]